MDNTDITTGSDAVSSDHRSVATLTERPLAEIESAICAGAANLTAAEYVWLRDVAEFDVRGGWNVEGVHSCAHWLSWQTGLDIRAAREKVRVAHALARFPLVAGAMESGRLAYSKVRALTRVLTPEMEPDLLQIAMVATTSQVERLVTGMRRAELGVGTTADTAVDTRGVTQRGDGAGMVTLQVRLTTEEAAILMARIDQFLPVLFDGQVSPSRSVQRADGLVAMALAASPADPSLAPQPLVTLHVECPDQEHIHSAGGLAAHPDLDRILCDAHVQAVAHDSGGEIAGLSQRSSLVSGRLRRMVLARDRHCAFPGCGIAAGVDVHHLVPRALGGDNRLDNLITLCRSHHRRVHELDLHLERTSCGVRVALPDGRAWEAAPSRRGDPRLVSAFERTAADARSRWGGEPLQLAYTVSVLADTRAYRRRRMAEAAA